MRKNAIAVLFCFLCITSFTFAQDVNTALLVVGDVGAMNEGDEAVLDRLESVLGFLVDIGDDDEVDSTWAEGMDLVYISSTVSSGTVSDKFKNVEVPVIMIEPYAQDEMGMTLDIDAMRAFQAFQRDMIIVEPDHYLAAGFTDEVFVFDEFEIQSGQGVPNENGVLIANYLEEADDDTNMIYGAIYCYEKGAVMADTTEAAERRLFAGWNDVGVAYMTDEGFKLFDATINWCLYKDQDTFVASEIETPQEYNLLQNYPNPFNPTTTISFTMSKTGPVELIVYDIQGRVVQRFVEGILTAGEHSISFNAQDLPSGVYLYTLITESFTVSEKMTLLR